MHSLYHQFRGKGFPASAQAIFWKLRTALQKRHILLAARSGWYGYRDWIRENEGGARDEAAVKIETGRLEHRPQLSLLIPWDLPSLDELVRLKAALVYQVYENWEVCLVLDGHARAEDLKTAAQINQDEPRIHIKRASPGPAPADLALQAFGMAAGEFVLLLEGGDLPAHLLLYEMVKRLNEEPGLDIVYSDEDTLGVDGKSRQAPFFKPDWSPELLLSVNYLRRALFRRSLMEMALAQLPSTGEGSYEDLVFRCAESARGIAHIPKVLVHLRKRDESDTSSLPASSPLQPARLQAIAGHLRRRSLDRAQAAVQGNGQIRVTWPVPDRKVSIIIPTRDHIQTLANCLRTLRERTRYKNYELILVDSGSCEQETHQYYAQIRGDPGLSILDFPGQFNYSAANNLGARSARGELFLFLNNDTEIIEPEWLEELVCWVERPEIGVVGALLLYPDRSVQHAGIVVGLEGHGSHVFAGEQAAGTTPFGPVGWYRNISAVTGACMAVRREVFTQLGGFDEDYELVFSDIEFCLRVLDRGYRNMVTPYACLVHHEGATRYRHIPFRDIELGYRHFKDRVERGDPYFNPNLSYAVRTPTFRRKFEDPPIERLRAIVKYSQRI